MRSSDTFEISRYSILITRMLYCKLLYLLLSIWGETISLMEKLLTSLRKKIRNAKYPRIVKTFIVLFSFIIIILLSEFTFILVNQPSHFTFYYLKRAHVSAQDYRAQRALNYLSKAAEINIKDKAKEYPEIIPSPFTQQINLPTDNPKLTQAYLDLISSLNIIVKDNNYSSELAKTFYSLGLLAHENEQSNLLVPLWQTAVLLAPEWSHFHIELANYYLSSGNSTESEVLLKKCTQLPHPKKHCQKYVEEILLPNIPMEVGFLEQFIEKEI